MSDATWIGPLLPRAEPEAKESAVTLPPPQPLGIPVLIGDVATPLAGETVLSLIWKRLDGEPGAGE